MVGGSRPEVPNSKGGEAAPGRGLGCWFPQEGFGVFLCPILVPWGDRCRLRAAGKLGRCLDKQEV